MQVYFVHPGCSGGVEMIELFMPRVVETLLCEPVPPCFHQVPAVTEAALRATFWFWPAEEIGSLRPFAARLFHDWFAIGRHAMGDSASVSRRAREAGRRFVAVLRHYPDRQRDMDGADFFGVSPVELARRGAPHCLA